MRLGVAGRNPFLLMTTEALTLSGHLNYCAALQSQGVAPD